MKVHCRVATPADRNDWIAMRHELWPACPVDRHKLEVEQFLSGEGLVVLAEVEAGLAGFAEVSLRQDHVEGTTISPIPYLEGWYVRPGYRAQGIGAALLNFVEQWALESGFSEIASDAELENLLSIRIHKKLGFDEVGRSVSFVKKLNR